MEIVAVTGEPGITVVRALFREYWDSFGFTPCFQNFGEELAGLPGRYAPPDGRLGVAYIDGEPAGCIALRRLDDRRCEAKRLYVPSRFRGRGVGRALIEWVITEARSAGYRELMGDTMPVMRQALELYERMGFERTEPYSDDPTPDAIYVRLSLA